MGTLMNWDHEMVPTSKEDLVLNLRDHLRKYTGYSFSFIEAKEKTLVIELANVPGCPEYTLSYNFDNAREIHGRVNHLGIGKYLDEIEEILFA